MALWWDRNPTLNASGRHSPLVWAFGVVVAFLGIKIKVLEVEPYRTWWAMMSQPKCCDGVDSHWSCTQG